MGCYMKGDTTIMNRLLLDNLTSAACHFSPLLIPFSSTPGTIHMYGATQSTMYLSLCNLYALLVDPFFLPFIKVVLDA